MRYIPGKVIKQLTIQDREIVFRYPKWEDLDTLLTHANTISAEDIFLAFSGEVLSRQEEMEYVCFLQKQIESGNGLAVLAFEGDTFVGSASVDRITSTRKRSHHVGGFGISLSAPYRGKGIGFELAAATIAEAQLVIPGLEMIILDVFSENAAAYKMYTKLGFVEFGRLKNGLKYKGENMDEVKMVKVLD
jgi:RimJ/RimL family protein N-acetyltransferase